MGEVDDDAGEKSGFGETKKKTCRVKMSGRADESHQGGANSPTDQNARNPLPRAPPFDDQGTGDFEKQVSDKEYTRAESEDRFREPQFRGHGKFGERDVCTIEVGDDIEDEDKGKDSSGDFSAGAIRNRQGCFNIRHRIQSMSAPAVQSPSKYSGALPDNA